MFDCGVNVLAVFITGSIIYHFLTCSRSLVGEQCWYCWSFRVYKHDRLRQRYEYQREVMMTLNGQQVCRVPMVQQLPFITAVRFIQRGLM